MSINSSSSSSASVNFHSEWTVQVRLILPSPYIRQMALIKYLSLCLLWLRNLASDFMRVFIWVGFNIIEGVLIVNDQSSLYLAHLIASLMASLITPDYFHKQWLCPRSDQFYLIYFCVISLSSSYHWKRNCIAGVSWICSGHLSALFNSEPNAGKWPEDVLSLSGAKRCSIPNVLYCWFLYSHIQI